MRVPFLITHYGKDCSSGWQSLDGPLRIQTTLDQFGIATKSGGEPMLRILQVRDLKATMGFARNYTL